MPTAAAVALRDLVLWGDLHTPSAEDSALYSIGLMIAGNRHGRELGIVINAAQVAAGLRDAQRLGRDEPGRGATAREFGRADGHAAPTRSIVWGKWWGTFRSVPRLLILPSVLTYALSLHTGHVWGVALIAALILAYGAAITSLGLALATWMPRMSRAWGRRSGSHMIICIGLDPLGLCHLRRRPGRRRRRGRGGQPR